MKTPRPAIESDKTCRSPKRARLLLVDDHPIFRKGLVAMLKPEPDFMVCAQAVSASEALEAIDTAKPDLAIVDVSLEGSHGIDLLKHLRTHYPGLPVIILSMHDEMLYAETALRAGAKGYVMKRESAQNILHAIRTVLEGGVAFSYEVQMRILQGTARTSDGKAILPLDRLSDRERQVLELIGQGKSTRMIAEILQISIKTAQAHRENLKEKLGVDDGLSLNRLAINWFESAESHG